MMAMAALGGSIAGLKLCGWGGGGGGGVEDGGWRVNDDVYGQG